MGKERVPRVGDVLWRMHGHRRGENRAPEWYAEPLCVEYVDRAKFLSGGQIGGSLNSIGVTYFWTREACLSDWRAHREKYEQPLAAAVAAEPQRLGAIVPDSHALRPEEDIVRIFAYWGPVSAKALQWREDRSGEFGGGRVLTLGEVRQQLGSGVLTVIEESFLRGAIYMTGNYHGEDAWRLYGHTMGFA